MSLLEVGFLIVFWTWAVSAALFLRNTFLPRLPLMSNPRSIGLPCETIEFPASDGIRLEGWKILSNVERPWIILCHGVGANRSDLLDVAADLHAAGLNLLLFDFRGHGESAGRVTSFGCREQRDLEGALAFLGRQPDIPATPYGIYGISMGASVAVMVAARDERIGAVALDSPYPNLQDILARHLVLLYSLPRLPFLWFVTTTYRLRFGTWPHRVSPELAVQDLRAQPLLLIQGDRDTRTPLEGTQRMFASAHEPKKMWVVPGAGHLESFQATPGEYGQRVVEFFLAHLGESESMG